MSEKQATTEMVTTPQNADLEQVARCLLDYLNVHGKHSQVYQVLRFLAENTLSRLAEGKEPQFNYFNIRKGVTRETEGEIKGGRKRAYSTSLQPSQTWKEIVG